VLAVPKVDGSDNVTRFPTLVAFQIAAVVIAPVQAEDAEVISIIDFKETNDGQILAVTNQMGCDYLLSNPFSLVKISIDGEFTLLKNYEESFYPSGLIKYGTGFIFYHTQFSNI
jgi:hypothetical protein